MLEEFVKYKSNRCSRCKKIKSIDEFYKGGNRKDGTQSQCKECVKEILNIWKENNPERVSVNNKKAKSKLLYGITLEDKIRMWEEQDKKCYLCQKSLPEFNRSVHLDHCHFSGKIRHILCPGCNIRVGHVEAYKRDPELKEKLDRYLEDNTVGSKELACSAGVCEIV